MLRPGGYQHDQKVGDRNMAGMQNTSSVRVEPARGDFNDVELSLTYVVPFTIHNTSNKMKRIRFIPPRTGPFQLNHVPQNIAPGLSQIVEVEFSTNVEKDYADEWSLITDDGQITIPLQAWFPCPNIQFDGYLSLGTTLVQQNVSKMLPMKNYGNRAGKFKLSYDQSLGLSVTPKQGCIQPNEKTEIHVDYFGSEQGNFDFMVNVEIEGQPTRRLDVTCKVVESRVDVIGIDEQPGASIGAIRFGTCYFGQTRTQRVKLVNQSPFLVSWHLNSPDLSDAISSDEDGGESLPIACVPSEGRLGAHGSSILEFQFSPTFRERRKGFARTAKKAAELTGEWKNTYVVDILETEQRLELALSGKAVQPDVAFSETVFKFGECGVNDHRDIVFQLTNDSAELPVEFHINRVAHFHAVPTKGILAPHRDANIRITFQPNQLGTFLNNLTCTLSGIKQMPLAVQGSSTGVFNKKQRIGGIDKVGADFESKPKLVSAQPHRRSSKQQNALITGDAFEEILKQIPAAERSLLPLPPQGQPADGGEEEGCTAEDALYMTEFELKRAHNRLYNQFLENMKANSALIKKLRHREVWDLKAVDLGMAPAEGLKPPEPVAPRIEEPLWLESGSGSAKDDDDQLRPRKRHKFDENRTIKKKFKIQPATLNEQRECKMVLSPKEVSEVVIGPKVLDFGPVSVGSRNVKSFFVSNDVKTHVLVTIPLNIREELKQSFPSSQVVPPGATAGFDIVFQSHSVQTFQQALYFTLNDHHKLKFVVFAEVVPIDLSLSQDEMLFRFNEFVLDSTLTQPVTISNNGNADAKFQWEEEAPDQSDHKPFTVSRVSGTIPAHGSVHAEVTYDPGANNESIVALILKVENGPSRRLVCNGSVSEAKCVMLEKKVDCGAIPVGCVKTKTAAIKNVGGHTAIFNIEPLVPGITCTPTRGRILTGSTQELRLAFRPMDAQLYQTSLMVNVRGGKTLRLPVRAEAKVPQVTLRCDDDADSIKFEDSFVGSGTFKPLHLVNSGNIPAILTLDLSDCPDFVLADQDKHLISTTATGLEEDISGPGGISIVKPLHDDDSEASDAGSDSAGTDDEGGSEASPRQRAGANAQDKGLRYRIAVPANGTLSFCLGFMPAVVDSYSFRLNISLAGVDLSERDLQRVVMAKSLKPRLVMSQTVVDFQSKVVMREGTSKVPNRILLNLSNEDDQDLEWQLAVDAASANREIFRIEPSMGKLQPGHSTQVQVAFTPTAVKPYEMVIPVYLGRSQTTKYTELTLRGIGSNPHILFDRPEVVLPVVPLDVPSKALIFLCNDGYEAFDVRCKVPFADTSKLPLTVTFPEGQRLTQTNSSIPVEIAFSSKKPISFTANLDFFDEEGTKFSIPVTGCADNCTLTTFSYIFSKKGKGYALETDGANRPIVLVDRDEGLTASTVPNALDSLDKGSDTPRSHSQYRSMRSSMWSSGTEDHPASGYERMLRKVYSKKHSERLRVWLNMNVLQDPIDDLVLGMSMQCGRPLIELIETMFGRPPPGRVNMDKLSPIKADAAAQVLNQYEEIIAFVKSYGGLLAGIRAEYLLQYEAYCRLEQPAGAQGSAAERRGTVGSSVSNTTGSPSAKGKHLTERKFMYRATHAWMTLIFQIIRIFGLAKIQWRHFSSQALTPQMKQVADTEDWSNMKQHPSTVGSNVYSVGESLLLKWLTVHRQAIYDPVDDLLPPGKAGPDTRILNFGADLMDGKALAAALQCFAPPLERRFDHTVEGGFRLHPEEREDYEHNLSIVLNAMKAIGLNTPFTPRDMLEFNQRDMLLFVMNLYMNLPAFIPKTTVKFKGHLHQEITKTIELKNPSKHVVDYDVHLWGSDEFKIKESRVRIEPQAVAYFTVAISPHFKRPVRARLTFLSQRFGPLSASMVFNLETDVSYEGSAKVVPVETSLYDPLNYELEVANPFRQNAQFNVRYYQERVKGPSAEVYPEEESLHLFPEAFWTATDMINVKKEDKGKMLVQFLPFVRGDYRCLVVFSDDKVGEFAVHFHGKALATAPFEKLFVQTESHTQTMKEVVFPFKNAALERGLNFVSERFKQFKSRDKKSTTAGMGEEGHRYAIAYGSPFWSGPRELSHGGSGGGDKKDKKEEAAKEGGEEEKARAAKGKDKPRKDAVGFSLAFNPKGPGLYPAKLVFASSYDVRVLELEGRCRSPGTKAELEFICPARQQITQDIPITNKSENDWVISSALSGEHFSAPREVRVPAGRTKNYPLIFAPMWVCEVKGVLTLKNNDTLEKYIYTLKGRGEEPLAENHISVECRAREQLKIKLNVPNIQHDDTVYTVESDLPFLSGDAEIPVPRMETSKYEITLSPALGGTYTGSVTFTAPNQQYLWYVITINVTRPPPEFEIPISSEMRKAVVAEIGIANPTGEEQVFEVRKNGDGLLGEDYITLEPYQSRDYELVFAPLHAGIWEGSLAFYSETVGEYWYKVLLEAHEPEPVVLEDLRADLGKSAAVQVLLQNPVDEELNLTVLNTNPINFVVSPVPLLLKPFGDAHPTITYQPSSMGERQSAQITFLSSRVGSWAFHVAGQGHPPTTMDEVVINAPVGWSGTGNVVFRNPFATTMRFVAKLRGAQPGPSTFALVGRRATYTVEPFSFMQASVSYSPKVIAEHSAVVSVQLLGQKEALEWEFPILGIAEASVVKAAYKFGCASRKEATQVLPLHLEQLDQPIDAETFSLEMVVPQDHPYKTSIERALTIERVAFQDYQTYMNIGPSPKPQDPEMARRHLFYRVAFLPLRPFSATVELVVRKETGACGGTMSIWRPCPRIRMT